MYLIMTLYAHDINRSGLNLREILNDTYITFQVTERVRKAFENVLRTLSVT